MKYFGIIECIMGLVFVWFVSCHYFEDASVGRIRETCLIVSSLAYNILIGPQEEVEVNMVRNNLLVLRACCLWYNFVSNCECTQGLQPLVHLYLGVAVLGTYLYFGLATLGTYLYLGLAAQGTYFYLGRAAQSWHFKLYL